ncbi:NUDIX hydrolase [Maribius pontilimi]|uniref:NUDIX hydrolase n=1 Tax=Palleronia pontilimi TaxID=1964209 RepID=A0A934I9F4_9RHOB|nr:NUDIX hydrolase [Palleronia pontilimi]MBJ3762924.1 NUDIX hydrolase [Palleronia pontilimi]
MADFPKLGAMAVVLHAGRALLVRRSKAPDKGLWGFPGGHVEPGETALAAAARELLEETGVIATPRGYLTNLDIIRRGEDGALRHHYLLAGVVCDYVSGTPRAADDALEAAWIAPDALDGMRCSAHVAEIIALATRATPTAPGAVPLVHLSRNT